jgi:hypothetical protein
MANGGADENGQNVAVMKRDYPFLADNLSQKRKTGGKKCKSRKFFVSSYPIEYTEFSSATISYPRRP